MIYDVVPDKISQLTCIPPLQSQCCCRFRARSSAGEQPKNEEKIEP